MYEYSVFYEYIIMIIRLYNGVIIERAVITPTLFLNFNQLQTNEDRDMEMVEIFYRIRIITEMMRSKSRG